MKKALALLLTCSMVFSLVACGTETTETPDTTTPDTSTEADADVEDVVAGPVEISVTSTFAGNDGNAQNYLDAVAAWEAATGNTVNDSSATADETFKARVAADFEVGAEPDVLFYFNGNDSDSFVSAGKVVSIEEIQSVYPEYASNMKMDMIPAAPADGVKYAIPVNGYWEGLFVNKTVLEAAGVAIPGADYTWDQFLVDCQTIKDAGFSPIAASLATVPHYWFEFVIYNQLSADTHCVLPTSIGDLQGQAWVNGLTDIKELYEAGYFPANTLSATDDETVQMFIDGKAAFLIDGSWKTGGIESMTDSIEDFTVTYVPGNGDRAATDIIGGLSSGWYITRKAFDDPAKQAAAVDFVSYMTSDEVVAKFGTIAVTALKNPVNVEGVELSSLSMDAIAMTAGATGITGAVQDLVPTECRVPVFDGMPSIVAGKVEIADAVQELLDLVAAQAE